MNKENTQMVEVLPTLEMSEVGKKAFAKVGTVIDAEIAEIRTIYTTLE